MAPAAGVALLMLLPACTSLLSYEELRVEIDNIQRFEGVGAEQRLLCLDEAETAIWLCKVWPTSLLFAGKSTSKLENPQQHVRDLYELLLPELGDDLARCVDALPRLCRMASLAPSPLDRVVALRGLQAIADSMQWQLADGLADAARQPAVPEAFAEAVQALRELRPAARSVRRQVGLAPAEQVRYTEAMARLTARPLLHWYDRVALVEDLAAAWDGETDPALAATTATALRAAMAACAQWTVVDALAGRQRQLVDVRLTALSILHAAGGADAVPVLLAWLASPDGGDPAAISLPQFDVDPVFRLRLVHLCGQLDGERARRVVVLPGRDRATAVSALDVLARIVLNEDPYYSPLRLPAQEALAHCLQRPQVTFDLDWVEAWYREFVRQS